MEGEHFGRVEEGFTRLSDKGEGEFVALENGSYSFARISCEVLCPETGGACMDFICKSFWEEGVRIDSLHITAHNEVVRLRSVYDRPDRKLQDLPLPDPKGMINLVDRFDKMT